MSSLHTHNLLLGTTTIHDHSDIIHIYNHSPNIIPDATSIASITKTGRALIQYHHLLDQLITCTTPTGRITQDTLRRLNNISTAISQLTTGGQPPFPERGPDHSHSLGGNQASIEFLLELVRNQPHTAAHHIYSLACHLRDLHFHYTLNYMIADTLHTHAILYEKFSTDFSISILPIVHVSPTSPHSHDSPLQNRSRQYYYATNFILSTLAPINPALLTALESLGPWLKQLPTSPFSPMLWGHTLYNREGHPIIPLYTADHTPLVGPFDLSWLARPYHSTIRFSPQHLGDLSYIYRHHSETLTCLTFPEPPEPHSYSRKIAETYTHYHISPLVSAIDAMRRAIDKVSALNNEQSDWEGKISLSARQVLSEMVRRTYDVLTLTETALTKAAETRIPIVFLDESRHKRTTLSIIRHINLSYQAASLGLHYDPFDSIHFLDAVHSSSHLLARALGEVYSATHIISQTELGLPISFQISQSGLPGSQISLPQNYLPFLQLPIDHTRRALGWPALAFPGAPDQTHQPQPLHWPAEATHHNECFLNSISSHLHYLHIVLPSFVPPPPSHISTPRALRSFIVRWSAHALTSDPAVPQAESYPDLRLSALLSAAARDLQISPSTADSYIQYLSDFPDAPADPALQILTSMALSLPIHYFFSPAALASSLQDHFPPKEFSYARLNQPLAPTGTVEMMGHCLRPEDSQSLLSFFPAHLVIDSVHASFSPSHPIPPTEANWPRDPGLRVFPLDITDGTQIEQLTAAHGQAASPTQPAPTQLSQEQPLSLNMYDHSPSTAQHNLRLAAAQPAIRHR